MHLCIPVTTAPFAEDYKHGLERYRYPFARHQAFGEMTVGYSASHCYHRPLVIFATPPLCHQSKDVRNLLGGPQHNSEPFGERKTIVREVEIEL